VANGANVLVYIADLGLNFVVTVIHLLGQVTDKMDVLFCVR